MTTYTEQFATCYGDTLDVHYDGTMFVAPACGSQHATRDEAMRAELAHYLRASGDDVPMGEEDDLDLDQHGEWIGD